MGAGESSDDLADEVEKLSLGGGSAAEPPASEETQQVVDIPDAPVALKTVAHWILQQCNKVVVLSGAGVSVAAGIPDFRTPGTGL